MALQTTSGSESIRDTHDGKSAISIRLTNATATAGAAIDGDPDFASYSGGFNITAVSTILHDASTPAVAASGITYPTIAADADNVFAYNVKTSTDMVAHFVPAGDSYTVTGMPSDSEIITIFAALKTGGRTEEFLLLITLAVSRQGKTGDAAANAAFLRIDSDRNSFVASRVVGTDILEFTAESATPINLRYMSQGIETGVPIVWSYRLATDAPATKNVIWDNRADDGAYIDVDGNDLAVQPAGDTPASLMNLFDIDSSGQVLTVRRENLANHTMAGGAVVSTAYNPEVIFTVTATYFDGNGNTGTVSDSHSIGVLTAAADGFSGFNGLSPVMTDVIFLLGSDQMSNSDGLAQLEAVLTHGIDTYHGYSNFDESAAGFSIKKYNWTYTVGETTTDFVLLDDIRESTDAAALLALVQAEVDNLLGAFEADGTTTLNPVTVAASNDAYYAEGQVYLGPTLHCDGEGTLLGGPNAGGTVKLACEITYDTITL